MNRIIKLLALLLLGTINIWAISIQDGQIKVNANSKIAFKKLNYSNGKVILDQTIPKKSLEGIATFADSVFKQKKSDGSWGTIDGDFNVDSARNSVTITGDAEMAGSLEGITFVIGTGVLPRKAASGNVTKFFESTIIIPDAATVLDVGFASPVKTKIIMNGGTLRLVGDLKISGSSGLIVGDGTIRYNGYTFMLDGTPRIFGDHLVMDSASDIMFNSKITLTGEWTFTGDAVMSGNGNIFDLSDGVDNGKIRIKGGTNLYLANLKLKNLGSGSIQFDDETARLTLCNVEIQLSSDYTVTNGGIYVEGPTTIVTKDKILTFDQVGSLTVDGVGLTYDTLRFPDNQNIRPTAGNDPSHAHLTLLNDGIVRHLVSIEAGDIHITTSTYLSDVLVLNPNRRLFVDQTAGLDGRTNMILFSNSTEPLIIVAPDKTFTLSNSVLQYFSTDLLSVPPTSQLIFEDRTKIYQGKNEEVNMTLTFQGNCMYYGDNHVLNLGSKGAIITNKRKSALALEDITFRGLSDHKIRCFDDTCTLTLKNMQLIMANDYSFTVGHFETYGDVSVSGTHSFVYQSTQQSKIGTASVLSFLGSVLSYAPLINNRDLLAFEDSTGSLYINGATLASTPVGLRLTKGNLLVDDKNYLVNPGALNISEGICFGNGVAADDLAVRIMAGASLNQLSGFFAYENVN